MSQRRPYGARSGLTFPSNADLTTQDRCSTTAPEGGVDFANAIRPLIEPRIDFLAEDVIVVTGSLEFLNPSQPRVDMTTKRTIKVDLNRCATNPPATIPLPPPALNQPAKQSEELKAALPETNSSYRHQSIPSKANNKLNPIRYKCFCNG